MSAAQFWATVSSLLLLGAMAWAVFNRFVRRREPPAPTDTVRAEVQRFREHPSEFAPLYHPGMRHRAIAAEVDGVLGQIEQAARARQDEVRVDLPDMDTARVAAEILVRFGYRCVVQRGLGHVLRVSWDGD